jgi:ABC-2 type transport system permease protein
MPIFDQGYQHWSGALSGHSWRWFTIARHGVRVGMKNIFLRLFIIASWFPAALMAFMLCLWGLLEQKSSLVSPFMWVLSGLFPADVIADPKHFRVEVWTLCYHYFMRVELYVSMVVVLLVGPGLISQDLRFNALQLYFSRPLRRIDYFVGKLGVIAWFLGLVIILPSLIAYVLGLLFSLDITILWDTYPVLAACLNYGIVIVLSAGTLMLALSSLSRNSRYIALFWVALWFVSGIVGLILDTVATEQRRFEYYHQQAVEEQAAMKHRRQPGDKPLPPEERWKEQQAWQEQARKSRAQFAAVELEASQSNWRPLVSYTANLSRIGERLLNSNAAKTQLGKAYATGHHDQDEILMGWLDPQYPWYWSAGVLAVLFGLSVCILNLRIRSLDRLK